MLLLHASLASRNQWHGLARDLEASYTCVAPDLYGYGAAGFPLRARFGLADEAQRVLKLLEEIEPTAGELHLAGTSYGASVALYIALQYPERVRSLALFEPPSFYLLPECPELDEIAASIEAASTALRTGDARKALGIFLERCAFAGSLAGYPEFIQESMAAALPKALLDYRAVSRRGEYPVNLSALRMPVRIVSGEASHATTRNIAARIAAEVADPRPLVRHGDHFALFSQGAEIDAIFAEFFESVIDRSKIAESGGGETETRPN